MTSQDDTMRFDAIDYTSINAIRALAMDMVEQAQSGHPGMPMGMAAAAYLLWTRHLKHQPDQPKWLDRDRFVLSAGHGSALLYALLHLSNYDLSLDDLKAFRQWGSKTPGHPEFGHTTGVEVTTGPLGQGFANAVGMAIEETYLAVQLNKDARLIDHYTYVIVGDGCLQEGVSAEAASLAGHLKLGKLIVLYDDNSISIDGSTSLSFTEDVKMRFQAYDWQVLEVNDGNSLAELNHALAVAKDETERPSLIKIRTHIGYGSPNKQGHHSAHGAPLGAEEILLTKKALSWPSSDPFHVPESVYERFEHCLAPSRDAYKRWQAGFRHWQQQQRPGQLIWQQILENPNQCDTSLDVSAMLPDFSHVEQIATRAASGKVLDAIMPSLPYVMAGSADLTPSNNTQFINAVDYQAHQRGGRYIRYGVREHAMGAILNGLSVGGAMRAYAGTFMVFADYLRPAIRLAALSHYNSIFVLTHDSIGVGEDGPTHQPVETLASLRVIPGLRVYRPADANETAQAWVSILLDNDHPSALILSRQNLPVLDFHQAHLNTHRGAYVVIDTDAVIENAEPEVLLMATGSEVSLALAARTELERLGIACRVISLPCWALFEEQDQSYRDAVLPPAVTARVAVEAAVRQGWDYYLGSQGEFVGMTGFGASAPGARCYQEFGITADAVVAAAQRSLVRSQAAKNTLKTL